MLPLGCVLLAAASAQVAAAHLELHVGSCGRCSHATIEAARDALRLLRGHRAAGARGARVVIHAGLYPPLRLDPALDSGSPGAPIVYAGYNADNEAAPVVSGGLAIPKASWRPAPGKPGALVADLRELGVTAADLGRLPDNGNGRGEADWNAPKNSVWWGTICEQRNASNQKAMLYHQPAIGVVGAHLARHPNLDPSTGRWSFLHGTAPYVGRDGGRGIAGLEVAANDSGRVLGWVDKEEAAFLHGYWVADWEDTTVRINATNASAGAVLWAAGTEGPQAGRNPRYLGVNLLCELDSPNEYHISRAGVVTFMPAASEMPTAAPCRTLPPSPQGTSMLGR